MSSLPEPISLYLHNLLVRGRLPAYLLVDVEGKLRYYGGDFQYYQLEGLQIGLDIEKQLPILMGLFPIRRDRLILPMVQITSDRVAELHIVGGVEETFVLFLDQSQEAREVQQRQQIGNELALLREKHQKLLDQYIGHEIAEELASDRGLFQTQGERRKLTVLFADIRGFTPFSSSHAPDEIFRTLNLYLEAMIVAILRENGVVDKILGDGVMALFGVLPSKDPAQAALRAAREIHNATNGILHWKVGAEGNLRGVGIGIASGVATLGVVGVRNRRSFTAIGHIVNVAARLESQALPGEVLVDEGTYLLLGNEQALLTPTVKTLKGIPEPVAVYSLLKFENDEIGACNPTPQ